MRSCFETGSRAFVAVLAGFLLLPAGAHSQAPSWHVELQSGIVTPSGDLQRMHDQGPAIGAALHRSFGSGFSLGAGGSLASLTGTRDELPRMQIWQYRVNGTYTIIRRASAALRTEVGAGAATLATRETEVEAAVFCISALGIDCPPTGTMRRFRGTYPLVSLGASLSWAVSSQSEVFIRLEGLALFVDEEDTAVFIELCDESRCFSSGYGAVARSAAFPLLLGVRLSL